MLLSSVASWPAPTSRVCCGHHLTSDQLPVGRLGGDRGQSGHLVTHPRPPPAAPGTGRAFPLPSVCPAEVRGAATALGCDDHRGCQPLLGLQGQLGREMQLVPRGSVTLWATRREGKTAGAASEGRQRGGGYRPSRAVTHRRAERREDQQPPVETRGAKSRRCPAPDAVTQQCFRLRVPG